MFRYWCTNIPLNENALSVLLGSTPMDIPEGIPSELLVRRPDIQQSEYIYMAKNAEIGVAEAMRIGFVALLIVLSFGILKPFLAPVVWGIIFAVASVMFTSSTVESVHKTGDAIEDETLEISPPNEKVKDLPFIGEETYEFWSSSNKNLTSTLRKYQPQLKELAPKLTKAITSAAGSIFLFIIAGIIAIVLLDVTLEQGEFFACVLLEI